MSDLPVGWARTTLGEVGEYLNGRGFKKSEWRTAGRPIIRIQNLTGSGATFNYFDGDADERHIAREGDLLVSWAATLGVFVWRGPEAVINQHIFKVKSHIDAGFHRYLLLVALGTLRRETHGSGMVHVTRPRFDGTPVPLPPLNEQQRIVAAIEEHLSRLDAAEASLTDAAHRAAALRDQAVSMTMRGDWPMVPLGDIADLVGGVTKDAKLQDNPGYVEVPYLRVANVQRGFLDLADVATIRVPPGKAGALALRPGDVLFNEGGDRDKLGRGWVWSGEIDGCIHQNHVFRARLHDGFDPRFVSWHGNTFGRTWFQRHGRQTTNLASLNLTTLKAFPVPAPPLIEQGRIVAEIEEKLSRIDAMHDSIVRAQARSASLRRAVLERAFRGELVPQDPNNERASELLDRIRAERDGSAATPRRRRARA